MFSFSDATVQLQRPGGIHLGRYIHFGLCQLCNAVSVALDFQAVI